MLWHEYRRLESAPDSHFCDDFFDFSTALKKPETVLDITMYLRQKNKTYCFPSLTNKICVIRFMIEPFEIIFISIVLYSRLLRTKIISHFGQKTWK